MSELQVELAGEIWNVRQDQELTMGRGGDVVIDDNPYLHRHFLRVSFADGFWWLANVGSRASATLSDARGLTSSRLGPGVRMPLVFGHTAATFTAGPFSYEINLYVENPAFQTASAPSVSSAGDTTVGGTSFTESQLLAILAVAEPLLRRVGVGVWAVPTAVQAAQRLGWTQTRFNRKLDNVCDKLDRAGVYGLKGGRGRKALGRRARLAEYAVNARIVTARDLPSLNEEHRRNELAGEVAS